MPTPLPRSVLGLGPLASIFFFIIMAPRAAAADIQPASLEWDAPQGCPSREEVLANVRGIVHSDAVDPPHARVTVTGPPWTARILVDRDGERGGRILEAASCEALSHAVALVVALSIDRAEQAPPREGPPPPPPRRGEIRDVTTAPERARDRAATFAALSIGSGLLPSVTPGAEAGVAFRLGSVELSVRGALFARSSSVRVERASGSFFLASAEGRLAWVPNSSAGLGVVPYVGLAVAYLRGDGRGSAIDQHASDWLPIPLLGLEIRARLGHGIEPFAALDAGLPLGRSVFRFREAEGAVHEPSAVAGRMSLGLRVALF